MSERIAGRGISLHGAPARFERGWREVGHRTWAWLQPNGGWGEANAGLVAGEDAALLIDTLWDERLAAEMLEAARSLQVPPVRTVVNTHSDGDHWWGNRRVPADAEIITSLPSLEAMRREAPPHEMARLSALVSRVRMVPGGVGALSRYAYGMLGPFRFAEVQTRLPDRAFSGRETLEVGGRKVELIEVGPAHTAGDLVVHVPDASVVFAADVMFVGVLPVMWHGPIDNWVRALDTLLELDAETYVPGHGPPCGIDGVRRMRDLMAWTERAAREHRDAGRKPLEAVRAMLDDEEFAPFRDWEGHERLFITVATIYSNLDGRGPLGTSPAARARVLRIVARLARELAVKR